MKRTRLSASVLTAAFLLLAGCSTSPTAQKKAEPKKPPEPVSGQSAIFNMYQVARTWAPDAMLLKLESAHMSEVAPQPGKYGLWRAVFVSQPRKVKRDFTYAAADGEGGIIKGVRPGMESMYLPNPQVHPLAIQEVKVDTPKALETAMQEVEKDKAMKKVLTDNKDLPIHFLLEWTGSDVKPTWRVIYGPSISQSKFSIFIDAYTGKFVKKLR